MLLALLALALADTTCATPALCAVVAAAARANATPGPVAAYTARLETEVAVIAVRQRVVDGATSVEQVASVARWERGGTFSQRIVGYRSATTALPLNRFQYLLLGWVAPVTAGARLPVFGRELGVRADYDWPPADTASVYAFHPLGPDRARHYRFTALDTVSWTDPAGEVRVVARLAVQSAGDPGERRLLFDGELWLELGTLHIVRVRGRLLNTGNLESRGIARIVRPPQQSFVDLQNLPVDGVWLPALQRFESIAAQSLTEQPSGGLRIVTRFLEVHAEPLGPDSGAYVASPGYRLSAAPRDSVLATREWEIGAMGDASSRMELSDFDDVRLRGKRGRRGSVLALSAQEPGEFVRLNRIEGLYVGAGVSLRPPRALPGTELHVQAGIGLEDGAIRGRVAPSWRRGRVVLGGELSRRLDHTNEFLAQFSNPSLGMLLSRDNWDYVDRSAVLLKAAYFAATGRGGRVELQAGYVGDRGVSSNVRTAPWVGFLRTNRGVLDADYFVTRLAIHFHPDIGVSFVRNGVGASLEAEVGSGSQVGYQRVMAHLLARQNLRSLWLTAQAHAGKVWGGQLPPQQLLEMGGAVGLPGYEYKEFAGDVGALGRVRLTAPLPVAVLARPISVGRTGLAIPSLTPTVSVGLQAGWTDVTTDAATRAMAGLGQRFDTDTGEPAVAPDGTPLPASVAAGHVRTSVDLRVGLFNDAIAVGVSQSLERERRTSFFFAFGQQF